MNFRCSGLLLVACLACLDFTSRQGVGYAYPSAIQNAKGTVSPTRLTPQNSLFAIAQIPPARMDASALEPGKQGSEVAELQKTLKLLGYFEDEVTGIYEESTSTAVLKFQKAVDLRGAVTAQVPAATKTLPSQPKGLPIWIYALGGVMALAGGFTLLRFAQKSRQSSIAQISSAGSISVSPTLLISERSENVLISNHPSTHTPNSHVTERSIANPMRNHAADLTGASHERQLSAPLASDSEHSAPEQFHESSTNAFETKESEQPDLKPAKPDNSGFAKGDDTANGHRNLTTTVENRSQQSPESALRLNPETPALSETTRLAKINIVDELIQELRTPDAAKRHKVIWELSHRGDTRAVQPLVDVMIDSDSKQRSLILSALSEIGTRTLRPMSRALAISLQDDNAEVRKNAIRDLTRVYDMVAQISQLLHQATDDPDTEVQETARWALGQLNRIRSVPGIDNLPALKNSVSPPESLP